jgi:hypothetical protein
MSYAGNVGGGGKNPYARDSRGEGRKLGKGLVFLVVVGLLFAPILHRVLHRFHWGESEGRKSAKE